jgi:ABC-type multidrug transport system ATPase subunit
LNILSQRVRKYNGDVLVNKMLANKSFRAASAFVQQDDVLMGNLTVRENLRYAALLRLGSDVSWSDKMKRIDAIINELNLGKCADTRIGVPGVTKGVSGGERKRTAVGMELLTEPSVLFLDEPTSGLDAKTSKVLMETLKKLANKGLTVVMTIHQPRSDIFHMFDKLLLLARGRVAYFGDASLAVPYYNELGYECPSHYNPADFFIDLISEIALNPILERREISDDVKKRRATRKMDMDRVTFVLDAWEHRGGYEPPDLSNSLMTMRTKLEKISVYRASWLVQFVTLLTRQFLNISRDTTATFARATQMCILAIVVGLLFFRLDLSQARIRDRIGVVFFLVVNQTMYTYSTALTTFMSGKAVYMRERGAKIYHVSSYYLAITVAELPNAILFNWLYGIVAYWMVGLNPAADRFFFFLLIIALQSLAMQAYGVLTAIAAPSFPVANTLGTFVTTALALCAGFWMNVATIPPWAIWLTYISVQHYGFEALVLNEFTGRKFDCPPPPQTCQQPTGETVIQDLALDTYIANQWAMVGFLLLLTIVARVLAYLLLRFVRKPTPFKFKIPCKKKQ